MWFESLLLKLDVITSDSGLDYMCGNRMGMNQISVDASVPQQSDRIFAGSGSPMSLKMHQWCFKGIITCANQYIYGADELLGSFLSPPPPPQKKMNNIHCIPEKMYCFVSTKSKSEWV